MAPRWISRRLTGRGPGRTLTSWPSLKTDIRNAGGNWVDTEVQVCTNGPNTLVTSRKPDDLPAFCEQLVKAFHEHKGSRAPWVQAGPAERIEPASVIAA